MIRNCWCGCKDLKKYSEYYNVCTNCHSLVLGIELPDDIYNVKDEDHDLYGKSYWEQKMVKLSGLNSVEEIIDNYLKDRAVYWLKNLLKYKLPNTSFAEIGCGLGQFPYLLKICSYKQVAYELSPEICDFAAKRLKINIKCDEIGHSKDSFDGVVAYDLLEHMIEPNQFMDDISGVLQEDGIICFQTPCYDYSLNYNEMVEKKPRFKEQMKQKEHVFLYSRESIEKLLKSHDFTYINFEPAYFGDDYDMFVFASRIPLKINTDKEIDEALNNIDNGRVIKALIHLFDEKNDLQKRLTAIENEATKRLENLEILTKQLEEVTKDSGNRLNNINTLTEQLKISEKDRSDRLDVINEQNALIKKKDKKINDLQNNYDKINTKYNKTITAKLSSFVKKK